jgi:hypothetical protein
MTWRLYPHPFLPPQGNKFSPKATVGAPFAYCSTVTDKKLQKNWNKF